MGNWKWILYRIRSISPSWYDQFTVAGLAKFPHCVLWTTNMHACWKHVPVIPLLLQIGSCKVHEFSSRGAVPSINGVPFLGHLRASWRPPRKGLALPGNQLFGHPRFRVSGVPHAILHTFLRQRRLVNERRGPQDREPQECSRKMRRIHYLGPYSYHTRAILLGFPVCGPSESPPSMPQRQPPRSTSTNVQLDQRASPTTCTIEREEYGNPKTRDCQECTRYTRNLRFPVDIWYVPGFLCLGADMFPLDYRPPKSPCQFVLVPCRGSKSLFASRASKK